MADERIKKAFYDGVHTVFSTMFNDGVNDGVYFYPLYEPSDKGVYKEVKYKKYLPPVLLVAKVQLVPTQGNEDVKTIKEVATFTITYKSLHEKGINVSNKNFPELRKGLIKYKDTFYNIDNIKPSIYVEDTFMAYVFECTEDLHLTDVLIEEDSNSTSGGT